MQTIQIIYYFRQVWNDPRLARNDSTDPITISHNPSEFIWVPDLQIINSVRSQKLGGSTQTVINADGQISLTERYVVRCQSKFMEKSASRKKKFEMVVHTSSQLFD